MLTNAHCFYTSCFYFSPKLLWRSPNLSEKNHFCAFTLLIKAVLLQRGRFNCTPYFNNVSLLMMSHILYRLPCCLITSPPTNNTVVSRASARGPPAALLEHKGCWIMSTPPYDCSLGRAWRTLIMNTTLWILNPPPAPPCVPLVTVHLSSCWCSCPTSLPPVRKTHVGSNPVDWTGSRWEAAGYCQRDLQTHPPPPFPRFNFMPHHRRPLARFIVVLFHTVFCKRVFPRLFPCCPIWCLFFSGKFACFQSDKRLLNLKSNRSVKPWMNKSVFFLGGGCYV